MKWQFAIVLLIVRAGFVFAGGDAISTYDKFKDLTTVIGPSAVPAFKGEPEFIYISSVAVFSGGKTTGDPVECGLLVTSRSRDWVFDKYQATMEAIFLIDGDRTAIKPKWFDANVKDRQPICEEVFLIPMGLDDIKKLVTASSSECQILTTEFRLNDEDKTALKRTLQKIGAMPPDPIINPQLFSGSLFPTPPRVLNFEETDEGWTALAKLQGCQEAVKDAQADADGAFLRSQKYTDLEHAVIEADRRRQTSTGQAKLDASHDWILAKEIVDYQHRKAVEGSLEVAKAIAAEKAEEKEYAEKSRHTNYIPPPHRRADREIGGKTNRNTLRLI